jgi:hypothetical protein
MGVPMCVAQVVGPGTAAAPMFTQDRQQIEHRDAAFGAMLRDAALRPKALVSSGIGLGREQRAPEFVFDLELVGDQ